jgi:hypothetical protein
MPQGLDDHRRSGWVGGVAYTQCGPTYYQRVATGYQVVVVH